MPYLRFFDHQRPCLLRAFFRPLVAETPLRFANPSPPSGWVKDFHLQVSVHTPHTPQPPFQAARPAGKRVRSQDWLPHSERFRVLSATTDTTPNNYSGHQSRSRVILFLIL